MVFVSMVLHKFTELMDYIPNMRVYTDLGKKRGVTVYILM